MHRKGFVSLYFLTVMMLCAALADVLLTGVCLRVQSAENIIRANAYLQQESSVINAVQCRLKNGDLENGSYETAGVVYAVEVTENNAGIRILQPLPELLILDFDRENGILMDYESIRSENDSRLFPTGCGSLCFN